MTIKLRTEFFGTLMVGEQGDTMHDAAIAHALTQAGREADALFGSTTRWYRVSAWIKSRTAEILRDQFGIED